MNLGLLSTRYAKALLDYACSQGEAEQVYNIFRDLIKVYLETSELKIALNNNGLHKDRKREIIYTACANRVPTSLKKMIEVILKNSREGQLYLIALNYNLLYRRKKNIVHGVLTTAIEPTEEHQNHIHKRLEEITGAKIDMDNFTDESLIGGFILKLDDYRWDASVASQLKSIKRALSL